MGQPARQPPSREAKPAGCGLVWPKTLVTHMPQNTG